LIRSTSRSFRPVDIKFGPDGALYIADWYNPIIGHYQASFRHPDRDKAHGRIWRVTAKGRPLTPAPSPEVSVAELFRRLESSDRWTRYQAKRLLADQTTAEVTNALALWMTGGARSQLALTEALGVCRSHEVVWPALLEGLCRSPEPGARAYAASTVGAWASRLPDPLALLRPLAADPHPRVRLHAVVAASYVPKPESLAVAARSLDSPMDKFLDYAFRQTTFALKSWWLPALQAGRLHLENPSAHLAALVRADGTTDTVQALRQLLQAGQLPAERRHTFRLLLAEVGEANDLTQLLESGLSPANAVSDSGPERHAQVLQALTRAARARPVRPATDPAP